MSIVSQQTTRYNAQLYTELRKIMSDMDGRRDKAKTLSRITGRSLSFCSNALTGRSVFDLEDCYKVLDHYRIPHERFSDVFPKNGLAKTILEVNP